MVKWWHFWNPSSGAVGGMINGAVIVGISIFLREMGYPAIAVVVLLAGVFGMAGFALVRMVLRNRRN